MDYFFFPFLTKQMQKPHKQGLGGFFAFPFHCSTVPPFKMQSKLKSFLYREWGLESRKSRGDPGMSELKRAQGATDQLELILLIYHLLFFWSRMVSLKVPSTTGDLNFPADSWIHKHIQNVYANGSSVEIPAKLFFLCVHQRHTDAVHCNAHRAKHSPCFRVVRCSLTAEDICAEHWLYSSD